MIEEEFPTDLILNAEPEGYLDGRGWLLLVLILAIAAWTIWSEYHEDRGDRSNGRF